MQESRTAGFRIAVTQSETESEEKIGYPEEIHDFREKFYPISHKKQEGVRISIVTTKM